MIIFFRKIRQQLLTENKIGKYLLYAIGEILLVMVGILLAFQVNQWNENNKNEKLEYKLLKEVETSLKSDLDLVIHNINEQEEIINHQDSFILWLESTQASRDSIIGSSYWYTSFNTYEGAYETLKQLGMTRIQNDSLRKQISKLYDITYPNYIKMSDVYENLVYEFRRLSGEHFSDIGNFSMKVNDLQRLRSDNNYSFQLKLLRDMGMFLVYVSMPQTKQEIELTLKILEQELD